MAPLAPVTLTRPWPEDEGAILHALSDWQVARWLTTPPWPYSARDARDFIAQAGLDEHAIRVDGRLVGMVQAGRAFGLWVTPDWQGRGIGQRAAVLALSRLFASGNRQVQTQCLIGNDRSARLLGRLGFRVRGRVMVPSGPLDGPVPADLMSLDRDDFAARHPLRLTTDRLVIDPVTPADLPALHRIVTRDQVAGMLLRFGTGMTLAQVTPLLMPGALSPPMRLAVRHQGRVVGTVGLLDGVPPRLAYFLDPACAGQGLGQEMVAAFLDEVVARLDPPEIVAEVFLDNPASRKILKNLGFRRGEDLMLASSGRAAPAEAALYRWRPGRLP